MTTEPFTVPSEPCDGFCIIEKENESPSYSSAERLTSIAVSSSVVAWTSKVVGSSPTGFTINVIVPILLVWLPFEAEYFTVSSP